MIEFLPAKRQFGGFSSGGGGGFRLETLNQTTSDLNNHGGSKEGIGQEEILGKRSSGVESMELGLDPELSFKFNMRRIGAGLENLGNTCFLNSVLQCLTYTEPLAAYLQSGKHKSSCRKAGFCALCAIQNHVSRALQATGRSLAPKDLVSNLRCISRNFRNARQEDAHEYMVNLLESMHKCCLPSGIPSESPSAFEKSLVHKIFGGRLRSQVKCMQCSFCSDKFDPFLDLSLEIDEADSLQKALAHFTAKEYLDGGAKEYQCQKCKQKVKALKQLSIHKAPYVLSIHLKRFGCHRPGQKINKKVHFGPTLDLKPFVTGAYDGDLKYTLYGVLVHYGGNTHSGHYSSYVRTSSGTWYSLDDHKVINVSEKRVLDEKAYMLFYVRSHKNITPKKPVDVHAKSMIIGAMENRMQSDSNQVFKRTFQNGHTGASKETLVKGKSILVAVQEAVAESSSLPKEVQFKTSSVIPIVKDDVKELSDSGDHTPPSAGAAGSGGGLNNEMLIATNSEINYYNKERTANENPSDLVIAVPNNICSQNLITKNNEKVEKVVSASVAIKSECHGTCSSSVDSHTEVGVPLKSCDEKESKIIDPSSLVEEPSNVDLQVGDLLKESTDGDSAKDMEVEPSNLLGTEATTITPSPSESLGHKSQRKQKKKASKSQIPMTRLSSGMILGAALGIRKKKHKKVKRCPLKIKVLTQENLGSSKTEVTSPLPIKVKSQKKRSKSSSSKSKRNISTVKNGCNSSVKRKDGVISENLRDLVGQNSGYVARDKSPKCISNSHLAGNGTVGIEGNALKDNRSDSTHKGIMNMLTRGSEKTIVARWDEMEHSSSHITETSGRETVSIGYIGDDWDEEYDKGKRKKVKTSITDFGGPNLFQKIATQNNKFKKAKRGRSSFVNQPVRI